MYKYAVIISSMKKITWNAPAVLGFVLLSLAALILNMMTGGRANTILFSVYRSSFTDPLTFVRLFTHVLGHADLTHYMNNMLILLLVGPLLEEKYGTRRMIQLYFTVALSTGLIHIFLFPNTGLLGASGIDFALILLSSITVHKKDQIPLTLILTALIYCGQQIYDGLFVRDQISQLSHLVGGTVGMMFGLQKK